jgi:hypothetical protein
MASKWMESFWLTRKESVTVGDPGTGETITREFSVGMTVKSDGSAKSDELYKAVDRSLNIIIEEEKENWMNSHLMNKEKELLKKKLEVAHEVEEESQEDANEGQEA